MATALLLERVRAAAWLTAEQVQAKRRVTSTHTLDLTSHVKLLVPCHWPKCDAASKIIWMQCRGASSCHCNPVCLGTCNRAAQPVLW